MKDKNFKKKLIIALIVLIIINFISIFIDLVLLWLCSAGAFFVVLIALIIQSIKDKKAKKQHSDFDNQNINNIQSAELNSNINNSQSNKLNIDTTPNINKIVSNEEVPTTSYEERKIKRQQYLEKQYSEFNNELASIPRVEFNTNGVKEKKHLIRDMQEIFFSRITKRTNIDKFLPLVVVDVETTGLRAAQCDIIEFSAIKYETDLNTPTSCLTTLLKSKKPIPEEASRKNNITDEMIADKPYFYQIKDSVNEYIEGCTIVGHNVLFDLKFLYVNGVVLSDKIKYLDTLEIAQKTLKKKSYKYYSDKDLYKDYDDMSRDWYAVEDYKLDTLCEYYNIIRDNAHRSLSDCLATAKLLSELIEEKQA